MAFPALRFVWLLLLVGSLLVGCGGSADEVSRAPLQYTIDWMPRSRVEAPTSALSMKLELRDGADKVRHMEIRNRPGGTAEQLETLSTPEIEFGSYTASFAFFAQQDASGDVVARASAAVQIRPGAVVGTIAVSGEIEEVQLLPNQEVKRGESRALDFIARNSQGQVVAVSEGSAFYTVLAGQDHLSVENGLVRGLTTGVASVNVRVDSIVSAAQDVRVTGETTITVELDPNQSVGFAAFQDGAGAWQPLSGPYSGALTFSVGSESYGVAVGTTGWRATLTIIQARTDELTRIAWSPSNSISAQVTGTISGLSPGEAVYLSGPNNSGKNLTTNGPYAFDARAIGPWDLLALRFDINGDTDGVAVKRNLPAPPLQGIDLDASADFLGLSERRLTVSGGEGFLGGWSDLITPNGTRGLLDGEYLVSGRPLRLPVLPSSLQAQQDGYVLHAIAGGTPTAQEASLHVHGVDDESLVLPRALGPGSITSISPERVRFVWQATEGTQIWRHTFFGMNANIVAYLTPAWLAGATEYTSPDFSALPNWSNAFDPGEFDSGYLASLWTSRPLEDFFHLPLFSEGLRTTLSDRYLESGRSRGRPPKKRSHW